MLHIGLLKVTKKKKNQIEVAAEKVQESFEKEESFISN